MDFIDELRSYLLQVQRGDVQVEARPITPDPSWVRRVLLELLEQLEHQTGEKRPPEDFQETLQRWTREDFAERFAHRLALLLQAGFLKGAPRDEVERYVRLGMALKLGVPESSTSQARAWELTRLAEKAMSWQGMKSLVREGWRNVPDYAFEIRAVRRTASRLALTPIGNVFLGLSGRDAVQWLLCVEVSQSTGPLDAWRLSREAATDLLKTPYLIEPHEYWTEHGPPLPWITLRRLSAMGLLSLEEDDPEAFAYGDGYVVLEPGLRALKALLEPGETPFSVLAATLSEDEALATLEQGSGGKLNSGRFHPATEAAARQARMVAHEIRNALLPAQSALDSLYSNLVGHQVETVVSRLRPRIDSGIERVLVFVREILTLSELATQPPEPFDLSRAITEARAGMYSTLDVQMTAPPQPPLVEGHRGRFVLAIVNLMRNAEQAGARHMVLDMKLDEGGQDLLLTVDDDGPGVAAEQRERIFQRGVSLRGGTGEGLALVKEVIESEMQGKVACLERPGGGARFLMRLPLKERRQR